MIRWRHHCTRTWAIIIAKIIGIKIQVQGPPPTPPFLLVSNHLSYIDIVVLMAHVQSRFVAKKEVESWPFLGPIVKSVQILFIDRSNRKEVVLVNQKIATCLKDGDSILFFPEGTSSSGSDVLPLKPSLLQYAAENNYPVHYASIAYHTPPKETPAHLSICWWGEMNFFSHYMKLLEISRFYATLTFGSKPIQATDRKMLAAQLREAIRKNLFDKLQTFKTINHPDA
ncbi:MAG: hypothetical protein GKR87_03015 [Kiritimatiellae bacterium]|nr:hypothetical protein [Kiritimatiellia bacterium]